MYSSCFTRFYCALLYCTVQWYTGVMIVITITISHLLFFDRSISISTLSLSYSTPPLTPYEMTASLLFTCIALSHFTSLLNLQVTSGFLKKGPLTIGITSGASTPDRLVLWLSFFLCFRYLPLPLFCFRYLPLPLFCFRYQALLG